MTKWTMIGLAISTLFFASPTFSLEKENFGEPMMPQKGRISRIPQPRDTFQETQIDSPLLFSVHNKMLKPIQVSLNLGRHGALSAKFADFIPANSYKAYTESDFPILIWAFRYFGAHLNQEPYNYTIEFTCNDVKESYFIGQMIQGQIPQSPKVKFVIEPQDGYPTTNKMNIQSIPFSKN